MTPHPTEVPEAMPMPNVQHVADMEVLRNELAALTPASRYGYELRQRIDKLVDAAIESRPLSSSSVATDATDNEVLLALMKHERLAAPFTDEEEGESDILGRSRGDLIALIRRSSSSREAPTPNDAWHADAIKRRWADLLLALDGVPRGVKSDVLGHVHVLRNSEFQRGREYEHNRAAHSSGGVSASVTPAEALFAFMGWLTSRDAVAGPFSSRHGAASAAELVDAFCKSQGWSGPDSNDWTKKLKPYPVGGGAEGPETTGEIEPEGLEWERITRAAWAVNPDWSKRERQVIEDFILTTRCYVAQTIAANATAPIISLSDGTAILRADKLSDDERKHFHQYRALSLAEQAELREYAINLGLRFASQPSSPEPELTEYEKKCIAPTQPKSPEHAATVARVRDLTAQIKALEAQASPESPPPTRSVFFANGIKEPWKSATITGREVKKLVCAIGPVDLFLKVEGQPDELVEDDTVIDLTASLRRFWTQSKGSWAGSADSSTETGGEKP